MAFFSAEIWLSIGADEAEAKCIEAILFEGAQSQAGEEHVWSRLAQEVLQPTHAFELHRALHAHVYRTRGVASIRPTWVPPTSSPASTCNITRLMEEQCFSTYEQLYQWSIGVETRSDYWSKVMQQILNVPFDTPPSAIFDLSRGGIAHATYLPGARLNITNACFHKRAAADAAIIFANEARPEELHSWSYDHLQRLANRVANALVKQGFQVGDCIGICMAMTPECIAIYLGIVKSGCSVVSIADSFSAIEIDTRLRLSSAKAIFTQDVIYRGAKFLPLFERVLEAGPLRAVVLPGALNSGDECGPGLIPPVHPTVSASMRPGQDLDWATFLDGQSDSFDAVIVDATHPANILFSSGTTGEPKAIVWSHSTPIKAAADGALHQNIMTGEVVCWPTNIGWMMGPWVLFQMMNGASIALFNGMTSTPQFCKFVELAGVNMLGVVPSLVKSWRGIGDGEWTYDWSRVRRFSSTGEASDAQTMHWLMSRVPGYAPVIEYCGGTEIGGSFLSSTMVQPNAPSTFSSPVLGSQILIVDDGGDYVHTIGTGEVILCPPTLGYSTTLLNRDHYSCYYADMPAGPGGEVLRRHGDEIEAAVVMTLEMEEALQDSSQDNALLRKSLQGQWRYFRALGRCDDTMNLGGIKISSIEIERVCNLVPGVHEAAAIAISPAGGGPSVLVLYVVLASSPPSSPRPRTASPQLDETLTAAALKSDLQQSIKTKLNPLFHIADVVVAQSLPRTASNKVMRRVLRDEYVASRKHSAPMMARSATYSSSVTKLSAE